MSLYNGHTARATKRMSWFLLFLIGVALTVSLYFVKTHAQSAKNDVTALNKAIAAEETAIRVLKAELAYLESPLRLSDLNDEYLELEPITPEKEISAREIAARFPLIADGQDADETSGAGETPDTDGALE